MNPIVAKAATSYIAPKLLRGFRLRWLVFGAAAYYGLRMMSKRGIFPKQADAALNVIDQGIGAAKSYVGMGQSRSTGTSTELTH